MKAQLSPHQLRGRVFLTGEQMAARRRVKARTPRMRKISVLYAQLAELRVPAEAVVDMERKTGVGTPTCLEDLTIARLDHWIMAMDWQMRRALVSDPRFLGRAS